MKNGPASPVDPPVARSAEDRIFYGWWILVAGAVINGIGIGIIYHCSTIFFLPLKRDLVLSSAAVSLIYGAARLEGGIEGPLFGYLIDRLGARRMIIIGSAVAGTGMILLSTVQSFLAYFLIYVLVVATGSNAGFFHPVTTAVNKWFIRRRGLAFSIISAAGAVGGMIMAPLLSYVILTYGWRNGSICAGLIILAIAIPAALFIKPSPEALGLHPDGQARLKPGAVGPKPITQAPPEANFNVRQALRMLSFWVLMGGISLRLLVTIALNIHFVPIVVWKGMSEAGGAYLVSLFALVTIPMSLVLGWIGDRWNKALLSGLCIVPTVAVMMAMIVLPGNTFVYFFPIALGITMGSAPLNWALIGDLFGRTRYATLRGIMGVGYGTATFLSPIYAGWIFDRTQSYDFVILAFAAFFALAAALFAFLGRPMHFRAGKPAFGKN